MITVLKGIIPISILARDHFTCQYCGRRPPAVELHVDHIVSRADGGSDHPSNLAAACIDCNLGKSALSVVTEVTSCIFSDAPPSAPERRKPRARPLRLPDPEMTVDQTIEVAAMMAALDNAQWRATRREERRQLLDYLHGYAVEYAPGTTDQAYVGEGDTLGNY